MTASAIQQALDEAVAIQGRRYPALSAAQIKLANDALHDYGLPSLPDDLAECLQISNGFYGPTFSLNAAPIVPGAATGEAFPEPCILSATAKAILGREIIDKQSLMVGRSTAGPLLTFHAPRKIYVLLDAENPPVYEYETFPSLLAFLERQVELARKIRADSERYARNRAAKAQVH